MLTCIHVISDVLKKKIAATYH